MDFIYDYPLVGKPSRGKNLKYGKEFRVIWLLASSTQNQKHRQTLLHSFTFSNLYFNNKARPTAVPLHFH
jgi:hypothetical protein